MIGFSLNLLAIAMISSSAFAVNPQCLNKMFSPTGEFTSPNYPLYPANSTCEYVIRANRSYFIEVNFTTFQLQPPENGTNTDYIQILDGSEGNPRQEVTYNGSQTTPFTFLSQTNKISIIFVSDDSRQFSGFKARYRFIQRCKPLQIQNGKAECDTNMIGLVTKCDVSCNNKYVLQGQAQCKDGSFSKPQCVVHPDYRCNFTRIQQYKPKCQIDKVTGDMTTCNYFCKKGYVAQNNGIIRCINGVLENKPICLPNPKPSVGPTKAPKQITTRRPILQRGCSPLFCWVSKKTRTYFVKCKKYARSMQKRFNESNKKRKLRETHCFRCQNIRCGFQPTPMYYQA